MNRLTTIALLSVLGAALFVGCTKASGRKVLRIWHTELDPAAQAIIDTMAQEFEKDFPGVTVEQEGIPWGQLNQRLVTALEAGDPPDLTHLEPFMVEPLYRRGELEELNSVIGSLDTADIYPQILHMQYIDGNYYGLPYAVGSTFIAVRKDLMEEQHIATPTSWDEIVDLARRLTTQLPDGSTRFGVTLPGDTYFIDTWFAELVASNGGRLFDDSGEPMLNDPRVVEAAEFVRDLAKYAPPTWTSYSYLQTFQVLAAGNACMAPITYARALKNIEKDSRGIGDSSHFTFIPQPPGPSGSRGYATLDVENWSVMKRSKNPEMAHRFLSYFYRPDLYARFCQTVPIHLTPIFRSLAEGPQYLDNPMVKRWWPWQLRANEMLEQNQAYPVLFTSWEDKRNPVLMEFQSKRIITEMLVSVCTNGTDPVLAANEAQQKAKLLVKRYQ